MRPFPPRPVSLGAPASDARRSPRPARPADTDATALAGAWDEAYDVQLDLLETGVCSSNLPGVADPTALADLCPMLQQLPPAYRAALERVEFDGVSQVDVAAELGISVSGLKSRVQRAMLREGLQVCCEISRSATGGVLDFSQRGGGSCGAEGGSTSGCA